MTKINISTYVILVGICALTIILFFRFGTIQTKYNSILSQLHNNSYELQTLYDEQLKLFNIQQIPLDSIKLLSIDNNQFSLSDSLNKNILTVCISAYNCKDCLNFIIQQLNTINSVLGKTNLCIISDKYLTRDIHIFKQTNNIPNIFYFTLQNSFSNALEIINMPIMFVANKNNTISHTFIPHKESPEQFIKYLDIISNVIN